VSRRAVSEAALSAAEAANRSKDELAMLSMNYAHLTAIMDGLGYSRWKLDEEKTALALETIERNANLQMQLIEDLLDISRIIRGDLPLSFRLVERFK